MYVSTENEGVKQTKYVMKHINIETLSTLSLSVRSKNISGQEEENEENGLIPYVQYNVITLSYNLHNYKDTHTHTDINTDTHTDINKGTDINTDTHTDINKGTDINTDTHTHTHTHTHTLRHTHNHKHTQTLTERHKHRHTHRHKHRQTHTHTDTDTEINNYIRTLALNPKMVPKEARSVVDKRE